jgi:hypothetical protein
MMVQLEMVKQEYLKRHVRFQWQDLLPAYA